MINIPDHLLPTNEEGKQICAKCRKSIDDCVCPTYDPNAIDPKKIDPFMRIEKSGRKGKTVTVIDRLAANDEWLKNMSKKLKAKCGGGGTFYIKEGAGVIEVQGDQRDKVRQFFQSEGIKIKG